MNCIFPQVKPFLDKSQNKKRKLKSSSKGELSLKKLRVEHKRLADVQHVPLLYEVRKKESI